MKHWAIGFALIGALAVLRLPHYVMQWLIVRGEPISVSAQESLDHLDTTAMLFGIGMIVLAAVMWTFDPDPLSLKETRRHHIVAAAVAAVSGVFIFLTDPSLSPWLRWVGVAVFTAGVVQSLWRAVRFTPTSSMSQPYLPNIPTMRLRWQSFRNRWNVTAVGVLVASILVLTVFNTYFNTYKAHFYQKESLRLYAHANPIETDRPQIRFTEQLIAFNSGTTTVAVVGLRIETWKEVNPHPPPKQMVSHFGEPVSNSLRAFVLKPGDASEPLTLDVAIDGPKYYGASAPIPGSTDRILTLQLVVQTVSADTHMLRLFDYPFMRLRLDPSGSVSALIEVGFSPELSSDTPHDIHWDERMKMLDRPRPN